MKYILFSFLILILLSSTSARAAFYQWTDANGVIHFTDDPKNIPRKYQDRARQVEVSDPGVPAAPESSGVMQREPLRQQAIEPGGHGERWWRDRYKALRTELKTLQDSRTRKEQDLVELRRKRTFFHRASDRQAINVMEADIAGDDAKISETLNRIQALDLAAAQAGVPLEWRQ